MSCIKVLEKNNCEILDVIQYLDGIVSCDKNGTIKIWSGEGECIKKLEGHTRPVKTLFPYNDNIVSYSYDNTIRIWDDELIPPK